MQTRMRYCLSEDHARRTSWGINLYPGKPTDWIEYIALINLKPAAGNRSMQINDPALRKRIEEIVNSLIA